MAKRKLIEIINYIVTKGISAVRENTEEADFLLDYVAIFSKSRQEYSGLVAIAETMGRVFESAGSGETFILDPPIGVLGRKLQLLKIRKPDRARQQRGAPDFRVNDYNKFKEKYLKRDNFNLVERKDYEMMELAGEDVLVYFPNKPLSEDLKTFK